MPCAPATVLKLPTSLKQAIHDHNPHALAESIMLADCAAAASGGCEALPAVVECAGPVAARTHAVPAEPVAPMSTPLDRIRAHLLPVARLLHQGADAVAARALARRIAHAVVGQHGVNKAVAAEANTQTAGSALLCWALACKPLVCELLQSWSLQAVL